MNSTHLRIVVSVAAVLLAGCGRGKVSESQIKVAGNGSGDTLDCGSAVSSLTKKCRVSGRFDGVELISGNSACNAAGSHGFVRYNPDLNLSVMFTQSGCEGSFRFTGPTGGLNDAYTKFNPGHYVKFPEGSTITQVNSVLSNPAVKGILLQVTWKELNPQPGDYESGIPRIRQFLDALAAQQKHLMLMFLDYSADTSCGVLPSYIKSNPNMSAATLSLPSNPQGGGCMAMVWKPAVLQIWKAINARLAEEFDSEPYFEGMRTRESTYAVDKRATGYSDALLVESLASLGIHAKSVFKHTNFFLGLSRIGGKSETSHLTDLIEKVKDSGVGIAWPDTIGQLMDGEFDRIPVWELAKNYSATLPIFPGGDTSGTRVPSSSAGNREFVKIVFDLVIGEQRYCSDFRTANGNLIERCTDGFQAPYFYWIKTVTGRNYPQPVTSYFTEAMSFLNGKLNAHQEIVNRACPSSIQPCRCTSSNAICSRER